MTLSIGIGGLIVLAYTLLGGFWAVSVTDTMQGLLMAGAAFFLPLVALLAVGGWTALITELAVVSTPGQMSLTGDFVGVLGLFFVLGTMGIGLGYPGQPHVLNRFMALNGERSLRRARLIAVVWAVVVFAGMLLLGLCARVLFADIADPEQAFFEVANRLLPPVLGGAMIAAVLSAVMSTADSQLLVAASAVSHDLALHGESTQDSLQRPRWVVVAVTLVALGIAVFLPQTIFSRVVFAWNAIGSAFGPLVLLRISGYEIRSRAILWSLMAGFGLTVLLHFLPDTPGDIAERILPWAIAAVIAFRGRVL
jgi:Na+/proline symporter